MQNGTQLKEVLKSLGFDEATVSKFEKRFANRASGVNTEHASQELQDALEAFATKPDNQSLGKLLILTGQAVETDKLCDDCLLTIFTTIGEVQACRKLAEAIGVPFSAVHVL